MKTTFLLWLALLTSSFLFAQNISLKGQLQDRESQAILFANVALYAPDSTLIKVETSDENGVFQFQNLSANTYRLVASYLGYSDLEKANIIVKDDQTTDLGVLSFGAAGIELATATVTTTRSIVEVKPDRTVFNVQGTINAVGDDGLSLLRKAPGVTIDNNDNINVLSRSGVLVYVDGKRLPLAGDDLANYLRSLTAEQIDRIDIITNPGAKYEAEGNAGIIDIRLRKNENEGANGSASYSVSQGRYNTMNGSLSGNYRNKNLNAFGNIGAVNGENFNAINFDILQNGLRQIETLRFNNTWNNINFRLGTDFFLSDKHTIGFLIGGQVQDGIQDNTDDFELLTAGSNVVDSLLFAGSRSVDDRDQATFNINYRFDPGGGKSLNIDLDYGRFRNESLRNQPNVYTTPDGQTVLNEIENNFDLPIDIDIYTFKTDYEMPLRGGNFGTGVRLSRVTTDNSFLFFDVINGADEFNKQLSNRFNYEENVYAGYVNLNGKFSDKVSYSAGLRTEVTDAVGELTAFVDDLQEAPVNLDYVSLFPSAGLTFQLKKPGNSLALNYGRRINRPDYNVLNPFRFQESQLSFSTGNPFLRPEIVNNLELGYTLGFRYNFKLAYSRTSDQITRLIGPDPVDPRAGSISWDNLASQTVYSFNASLPFQFTKGWNAFFNASASYIDNQADYGENGTIDLQAFSYSIFSQHTFNLPGKFTFEVSGYFAGPGIWGGVFEYDESWSLNLGLQKKFFNDQLNVKISGTDLFYETGWAGVSDFNGQLSFGNGNWDSRRISLNLSYNFGNQKVKSRKRSTGLGDEAKRVGG
ncbi:MAG: TonB-dependent receptor [Bacteroidota bacterium]